MKKVNISIPVRIVFVTGLVLLAFLFGNMTGYLARSARATSTPAEFAIFWETWDIVVEHFVDQDRIDFTAMTHGAIQGMLDSLGDENHTVYFPPQMAEQQERSLEGSFEGIGAYVSSEEGVFTIVAPIHGSPAAAAGILAGDVVVAVNGEQIENIPQWEVISKIRGPAGTTVTLTILHPEADRPVDVDIVRGRIDLESVLWARIPGTELAYIQITQFADDTGNELRGALDEISQTNEFDQPVRGIVLDLRNNPGGFLMEALVVGSQFLPEGDTILHERDSGGELVTLRAKGDGKARSIPLVALVNAGSASAAEILAGALQENGRAKLVGDTTLGTGTVLRVFNLSDGSALRLGVTNWLTPEENLIKNQGIVPDIKIEQPADVALIDGFELQEMDRTARLVHKDRQFRTALLLLQLLVNGDE